MKPTVLDPQGQTIRSALIGLGHTSIAGVRQGKFFEITLEPGTDREKAGTEITWTIAIAVAIGQLIAGTCPGTSRSGATIVFCLLLGLSRPAATEFSFLVGIPTMLAAGGWKIFKAFHHPIAGAPKEDWGMLLFTTAVAAVVSFIAVKWLLRYVQTHTFNVFGWYRIALAILIFALLH